MRIEKLNEDKIRITFNCSDLQENNIDLHSFMSNSIENQSLFLAMLDEAEREVGFITDDYRLSIQAIALSNGTFIVTVTRIEKEEIKSTRVHARRKSNSNINTRLIYKFSCFDDFCNFQNFLFKSLPELSNCFSDSNLLYKYNDFLFLILQDFDSKYASTISGVISEFAVLVDNSDLVFHKIKEYGALVTENALHT